MDLDGNELYNEKGAVSLGMDAEGNNMMGDAEDIANAICFCLDDANKYLCGAEITVDGGWTSF